MGSSPQAEPTRGTSTLTARGAGLDLGAADPLVGAPVPVVHVTDEGRVTQWNPAAEQHLGWHAAEVIGRPLQDLLVPGDDSSSQALRRLVGSAPVSGIDLAVRHRDGTPHRVVAASGPTVGAPGLVLFLVDLTDHDDEQRRIADSTYRWRRLLENISDTITVVDGTGEVVETTGQFTDVLGYDADWWEGQSALDLIHSEDRPRADATLAQVLANPGEEFREVFRTRHEDGHYELIEYTVVNLLDDPVIGGIVISSGNVTEVKKAEMLVENEAGILELIARGAPLTETLDAIVAMVEHHADASAAVFLLDPAGTRMRAAGSMPTELLRWVETLRLDPGIGIGAAVHQLEPVIVEDFGSNPFTMADAASLRRFGFEAGWTVPIIESTSGEVFGCIGTVYERTRAPSPHEQDVGAVAAHLAAIAIERDRFEQLLFHQARHHQLTGLPNRHSIKEHLEDALDRARDAGRAVAAMFIDLDRFKVVNDSYGHTSGDKLLVRFAGRLQNLVRPGDFVGHFAADEFVVLLEVEGMSDVEFVAARIDAALREPFALDEGEVFLSVSMGVALSDGPVTTSEALLHQADAAMFRAKKQGGDRLAIYDDEMQQRAVEQLRVDRDLRIAIEQGDLEVRYQPEIDLTSGRVVGAEALLRWQHVDRGLVLPKEFIGVAEDTGLIVRIGRYVLEESIGQARRWTDSLGLSGFVVSVNLSARQLSWHDLVPVVGECLAQHDWPADQLMLEITESILIDDAEAALHVLEQLKALGVLLAIDDFGTGYSSLSYLHRFPVDVVKIDRAFVSPLDTAEGSPLATAVLHMSKAFGLRTYAEGVESDRQLAALRDLGCDVAQGFLFAQALPAGELGALLRADPEW